MDDLLDDPLMTNRMESRLLDIFAGIAVLLATIGSTRYIASGGFRGHRHRFSYSWSHPAQRTAGDRPAAQKGFTMSAVTQYQCEMCGTESSNPMHWFMIRCNDNELKVLKWNSDEASVPGTRHYCGEAHAGVYISRWLEASCSPSRPDFNRPSAG
jgi:hypothetical protein